MAKNDYFFKKLAKIKAHPELIKKTFADSIARYAPSILKEIQKSIERGVSPVEGKGRFVDYSDSYKNQIGGRFKNAAGDILRRKSSSMMEKLGKKVRPVNLTLSGRMMRTLYYKVKGSILEISFTSPIAAYHTIFGAGKRRVIRSLLPAFTGERLSRTVFDKFDRRIKKDLIDFLRKQ